MMLRLYFVEGMTISWSFPKKKKKKCKLDFPPGTVASLNMKH